MPGVDDIDGVDLMPLETPVLKVSRPVAACSRCRTAKIKCDGKLPACTSCERNGRADECTSTNDQFARGKERSYVSTLETRIDKLQAKLEDVRRRKPSVISIPDDDLATIVPSRRPSYEPRVPSGPPTPTTSKAQRREEASAIDELVSGFGFLSVNATARDFYGFTSAMSYARLILSACTKDPLPQGTNKALPPHNVTAQLVQHYFDNFFQLIPVFDKASFYASIDNVYRGQHGQAQPIDHWMLRMVLAIASATLSERSGDQHYFEGIGHVCAALEHAEIVLHPGSITSVQALVLLVEYAMLDPHHFDSWSLIGAASRAMIDLGLHQDPPKGTAMSKHKLELRRRVFWCVYCFDRSTSLVQTRAFSFSDPSAKVKVPFARQSASQPQSPAPQEPNTRPWMDSHQHTLDLIALRRLQSTWYSDLFQSGREQWKDPEPYIWKACDEMKTWFENISASASPNMLAFFELDMLYSYVYVLSPSPRVPVITPFAQTLIFEYCIRFADLMLQRISQPRHSAPTTFYDAMRVYMTGRQFLDVLQSNTEGLLSGVIPPRPDVKAHGRPPPPLPPINIPPGDNALHYNTARSINCIRQISDCLSRFGIRWGYMSWNQRYQNETSELLDELTGRLRELEVMAGTRRPSMWQTNSSGSIGSNNSGSAFGSPNNSVVGQPMYPSPPALQNFGDVSTTNSYVAAGPSRTYNSSPQYQPQDQSAYQRRGSTMPPNFARRPSAVPMSGPQQFSYGNAAPSMQPPVFNMNPQSQFGAWGGYGGPSRPDTLDEENAQQSPAFAPMQEPPAFPVNAETQTGFPLPSASYRARSILPFEFDGQGQRRPSMQEAADAMLWETFRGPGPTEQAMLPPLPSRDEVPDGRKVSFGQPLQPIDSNEVLSYQGKGKGRVICYDPAQQFSAWEEANMGGAGSFNVPGLENQSVPVQDLVINTSQFTFVPGQFETWQPEKTNRNQPQIQRQNTDIQPQISQAPQDQPLPSADPQTAQPVQLDLAPAIKWYSEAQLPLQQAFQPPPGFPQQPASPGQNFYPGSELQQLNVETAPPANIQPLPPVDIPIRSGYRFQAGRGFVCNVCSACVRQPGIHRFQGQNFWCYADGPEMRLDDEVDVQRWPKRNKRAKRARMELYIP